MKQQMSDQDKDYIQWQIQDLVKGNATKYIWPHSLQTNIRTSCATLWKVGVKVMGSIPHMAEINLGHI